MAVIQCTFSAMDALRFLDREKLAGIDQVVYDGARRFQEATNPEYALVGNSRTGQLHVCGTAGTTFYAFSAMNSRICAHLLIRIGRVIDAVQDKKYMEMLEQHNEGDKRWYGFPQGWAEARHENLDLVAEAAVFQLSPPFTMLASVVPSGEFPAVVDRYIEAQATIGRYRFEDAR